MQWCINTDRENPTEMVRGEGDGCCHFSSSPQPYHTILCAAGSRSVEERGRSISQHTLLKWFLYLALLFLDCLISSICLRQNFCKITSFPFPFLALLLNDMPLPTETSIFLLVDLSLWGNCEKPLVSRKS